jgi:hypothetical protein
MDLFFPVGNLTGARKQAIASVCGSCPVLAECHDHAVRHERFGYWANTGPDAREQERFEKKIPLSSPEIDPQFRKTIGTFYAPMHGSEARYLLHMRHGETPCARCLEAAKLSKRAKDRRRRDRERRALHSTPRPGS